jgi:hypothetical protein
VGRTPDRREGQLEEESILFEDQAADPTTIGVLQRNAGALMYKKDAGAPVDLTQVGGGSDIKDLKVSSNDTTAAFLETKLQPGTAGDPVDFAVENEGANEVLRASTSRKWRRHFLLMGG